jgi:hypothetical protein
MHDRHAALARPRDVVLVAAFLALPAFASGAFFIDAGQVMTARVGSEFLDIYRPGQSPWTGATIEPAPPQERFAGAPAA